MKKDNPLRNNPSSPFGNEVSSLSRRGFLKRSGGATIATALSWGLANHKVGAEEEYDHSHPGESCPQDLISKEVEISRTLIRDSKPRVWVLESDAMAAGLKRARDFISLETIDIPGYPSKTRNPVTDYTCNKEKVNRWYPFGLGPVASEIVTTHLEASGRFSYKINLDVSGWIVLLFWE